MDMDADLYEYYTATLERAFASDEVKNCRFLPDSAFAAEMAQNNDFIDLSRRIAGVILSRCCNTRPSRRAIWPWWISPPNGVPFYGVLKLNYRPGYTHHTHQTDGQRSVQQHGPAADPFAWHAQGRRGRPYRLRPWHGAAH